MEKLNILELYRFIIQDVIDKSLQDFKDEGKEHLLEKLKLVAYFYL